MLSLYEYIALDYSHRKEVLWSEGDFLTNVILDDTGYSLYSLFDFYVEVTLVEDEIRDLTPFKSGNGSINTLTRLTLQN